MENTTQKTQNFTKAVEKRRSKEVEGDAGDIELWITKSMDALEPVFRKILERDLTPEQHARLETIKNEKKRQLEFSEWLRRESVREARTDPEDTR
jgi:hypothetical protein